MKKRLLFLALTVAALCALFALSASAETSGYYTYTVSNGEATITGVSTSISGAVTIPSTLGGYPVTSIGRSAFYSCSNLTSVRISSGVTSIGNGAFSQCHGLTSITIPNSVKFIDEFAFSSCYSLTSITIPSGVTRISQQAFQYCESLTCITIPNSVTSIDPSAFYCCRGLTSITLSNSLTNIGANAFAGCNKLTSITIPSSITKIYDKTFENCTSLTSVTIPSSVTSIGENAFKNCRSLTNVTIPRSVTSISYSSFDGCSELTIFGYLGSTAENHAKIENISFIALDTSVPAPNITTHPLSATYTVGDTAVALSISATGYDLTYQWYEVTDSGDVLLVGEEAPSFTPDISTVGIRYYYVVVTNTNEAVVDNPSTSLASNISTVTVTSFSVIGRVLSYGANDALTIELLQNGEIAYTATVTGNDTIFTLTNVLNGTYTLRIRKPLHLDYTIAGIVVDGADVDLTKSADPRVATINMVCGDLNGDGLVNVLDVAILRLAANYGKSADDCTITLAP